MSSLRKQLRLTDSCSDEELQKTCNRYYALYKGVLESSAEESVRTIARSKLSDLVAQCRQENVQLLEMDEVNFATETANINATVEQAMAGIRGSLSGIQARDLNNKIAKLPHSAKRYYLSALVIMQSSNPSVEAYREAAGKLMSACSEDPENPVYQAALDSIKKEIESYNAALEIWREKRQEELKRQQNASRWKAFFSGLGAVFAWIGQALLWIGGALLTVGSLAFSCMCGMFECCDVC